MTVSLDEQFEAFLTIKVPSFLGGLPGPLQCRRRRHHDPSKCPEPLMQWHSVAPHKTRMC